MEEKELHETQPASPIPPDLEITPAFPTKMHPSPSHKSKWLLILTVGFLLILIAIYIVQFLAQKNYPNEISVISPSIATPTLDPTANWKTYTNTKVGFTVKYPQRLDPPYTVNGTQGEGRDVAGTEDDIAITWGGAKDWFELEFYPFTGKLEELQKNGKNSYSLGGQTTNKFIKESVIDGQKALWFLESSNLSKETLTKIYFLKNNHGFTFYTNGSLSKNEFNQILSTFKFTDSLTNLPDEVKTFPVYPSAVFVKREYFPTCSQGNRCNTTEFSWKTTDDGESVLNWYKEDKTKSGWVCGKTGNGGIGGPREMNIGSGCDYQGKNYGFSLDANEKETVFSLSLNGNIK